MSATAQPKGRRGLLLYAIGFDLVLIAVGLGLLLPPRPAAVVVPFIAAVGLAAWRGGWRVGVATTAFSVIAILLTFASIVPAPQLLLFALAALAASVLLDTTRMTRAIQSAAAARQRAATGDELRDAARAAERSRLFHQRVLHFVVYVGLPALVVVVYTNVSTVLVENFSMPSVLQPLILFLAVPVIRYHHALRPGSAIAQPATIALVAYFLIVFTSTNWARDAAPADLELTDLIKSLILLIVVASLAVSWRALRGAMMALVAGAVVFSVLTLIQIAVGDPTLTFGGLADLEEAHVFGESLRSRPSGSVADPNYFARILILAFPAAAFLGIGRPRREQAAYLAAAAAIALTILFTYSRGGMLTLAVVCALLVAVGRVRITRVTLAAGVVLLLALLQTPIGQRLLTIADVVGSGSEASFVDASVSKRKQLLAVAWQMFSDHPVVGVGVGNFGSHYASYADLVGYSGPDYTPLGVRQYAHNLYLETAVETGLLGLLAFIGAMAVVLVTLHRARRTLLERGEDAHAALVTAIALAIIGYLIASVFLQHSGFQRYLWMILGFAIAAARLSRGDDSRQIADR